MIFNHNINTEQLNVLCRDTMISHLGIEFTEISDNSLKARMPVDRRTVQPYKVLHGGASLALAETLGSIASYLVVDQSRFYCVGMEINANHIRPAEKGWVIGEVTSIHIGKKSHIWQIIINNEENKMVCISRITMAILEKKDQ